MTRRLLIIAALLAFVPVSPAWADNTTAANARELLLGQAQRQTFAASQSRWYKAHLVEGRSYSILVWAPFTDPSQATVGLDSFFYLNDGTTLAATVTTGDIEPRMESSNNGDQTRIIPTTTVVHRINVREISTTGPYDAYVMLVETTLFSPWYYAVPNYDGFITMRNNTSSTVSATVTIFGSNGSVLGTTTLSILANGNTYVTATSLGGTGTYGSAQIAHTGSLNAITANITTMSGATGLSFDVPFTTRMSWSMMSAQ